MSGLAAVVQLFGLSHIGRFVNWLNQTRKSIPILYNLNKDIPALDLGEPMELLPKVGDVLFFQHLFGHNGARNTGPRPRLMMRYFCTCRAYGRWKKTDD